VSGDEIRFGDVQVREPRPAVRPDRDPHYACTLIGVAHQDDLAIFLDHETALAIEEHARSDVSVELGGVLLGKECVDPDTGRPHVLVTAWLEAAHYKNTQASFTYTHESWEAITRRRDLEFPDLDIVGWYHTHPNFGIFLSHHDLFIHQNFFGQPLQTAYVVDPIKGSRGFFQWRGGTIAPVQGFQLTAGRKDRRRLASAADLLEGIEQGEDSGLSPSLEREILAMMTRQDRQSAAARRDHFLIAGLAGALGMFVGCGLLALILIVVRAAGLSGPDQRAVEQLAASIDRLADGDRLAMDVLREKLESESPSSFVARYAQAARERDQALKRVDAQRAVNEALAAETSRLKKELAEASALAAAQKGTIAELAAKLDTIEGKTALEREQELVHTRYLSYGGWGAFILAGLGLATLFFRDHKPMDRATLGERSQ